MKSVYYTDLLHNFERSDGSSVCNDEINVSNDYYTKQLHKKPKGLCAQGHIYHYRKRVPNALKTVVGRSELWVSLNTGSYKTACRRIHAAAARIEARLELVRHGMNLNEIDTQIVDGLSFDYCSPKEIEQNGFQKRDPKHSDDAKIKTLGTVYTEYTSDPRHSWSPRTALAHRTTEKWVLEFFGSGLGIASVSREKCRQFVDMLSRVPRHADRKYKGLSLAQAIEAADAIANIDRISVANVNAYINRFSGLINWAIDEGYIDRNPLKALKLSDPVKKKDKRNSFSDAQLIKVFNAPLYRGCVNDENGYAKIGLSRQRWLGLSAQ